MCKNIRVLRRTLLDDAAVLVLERDCHLALGRLDHVVHEKGLRDRSRIGHACRLDDDRVEVKLACPCASGDLFEDGDQVLSHRTADAPVEPLGDVLGGAELRVPGDAPRVTRRVAQLILDCERRRRGTRERMLATAAV